MRIGWLGVLILGMSAFASPLMAHHGTAGYDTNKVITLTGTVTEFDWSNPHVVILMDVKKDDGQLEHWTIELAAPIHMARFGWGKSSMKPGDRIVAETHPAKNGSPIGTSGTAGAILKVVVNGQTLQ